MIKFKKGEMEDKLRILLEFLNSVETDKGQKVDNAKLKIVTKNA